MKPCKYDFSDLGIKEMYNDSLEMIWDALEEKHPDFNISDLDIHISIGDKKIIVPLHADSFEMLFTCLEKISEDTNK
jgi:hypothetical protein